MCGICGKVAFANGQNQIESVVEMTEALSKRGPDAMGLYVQGRTHLGHRRLKVIDLSEKAQQPMVDNVLGLSIVYNGALYNYQELRKELGKKGYIFFSDGDTEVILKAYHAWGEDCVNHFNGMFAFAIVHRDSGRLFLARDRLGIKPLYYTRTANEFRFASTLPALIKGGNVDTDIDAEALHYYMTFHSVVPAPRTILKGLQKLPPGTTLTLEPDGREIKNTYWSLSFGPKKKRKITDV